MFSNNIIEVANLLYAIAHSHMVKSMDYVDEVYGEIFENHQGFSKETYNLIGLELMCLYLHVTARIAYKFLGEDKTWELQKQQSVIFKEHMMSSVEKGVNKDEMQTAGLSLQLMLSNRHLEYGECKCKEKNLSDSYFWEAGKHVSVTSGHPYNVAIIATVTEVAMNFASDVKWQEILGQITGQLLGQEV